MTWLLVAVGAAVGAPGRYLVNRGMHDVFVSRRQLGFPFGTLSANLVGSAVLGSVLAAAQTGALSRSAVALLGTGFCGAFTTFSTFAWETDSLVDEQARGLATLYVVTSVVGCIALAALTWWATSTVFS
jgi:fluoride exporter